MTSRDLLWGFDGEMYQQVHGIRNQLGEDAIVTLIYDQEGIKIAAEWCGLHTGVQITTEQVRDGSGTRAKNFAETVIVEALRRAVAKRDEAAA